MLTKGVRPVAEFIIIAAVLLVAIGIGLYFALGSSRKTVGQEAQSEGEVWTVYKNPEQHFSFNYPRDFEVKPSGGESLELQSRNPAEKFRYFGVRYINRQDGTTYETGQGKLTYDPVKSAWYLETDEVPMQQLKVWAYTEKDKPIYHTTSGLMGTRHYYLIELSKDTAIQLTYDYSLEGLVDDLRFGEYVEETHKTESELESIVKTVQSL